MGGFLSNLILRGIAGGAGFIAIVAAGLHRKSSAIEARARKRLTPPNGYGIGALEHDCWDRDDRCEFPGETPPAAGQGKPAAPRPA